jgi:Predicted ATPase (AAA+ superfamily)
MSFPDERYYDLESPSIQDRVRLDPENFLAQSKRLLILDEIQSVPELMPALKVVIDQNRNKNGRFLILGSANPTLLKNASESLAGRIGFLDLDPFTFQECHSGVPKLTINDLWVRGGYAPVARVKSHEQRFAWLEAYIRTFIERDLPRFHMDIQSSLMRKILFMISHVHGGLWNASQIASSTGVSYHTANRYLEILEGAFLIRIIQPYFVNIGKRLTKAPKIFIRDSGLRHYLLGIGSMESLRNSPYCGSSWEGFIIEEIIRYELTQYVPGRFFFYRTQIGLEADLVFEKSGVRSVIEIKLGSRIDKKWIKDLKRVMIDIKSERGFLIYSGKESFRVEKNISIISAYENKFAEKIINPK